MKKFLSAVLAIMMLVTCFATVAFAADDVSVSGSTVKANAGETVTVDFTVSGEHAGYQIAVSAEGGLKITGAAGDVQFKPAVGNVVYFNMNNVSSSSFSLTVEIPAGTPYGEYAIKASVNEMVNAAIEDLGVDVTNGMVILEAPKCDHDYVGKVTTEPGCETEGVKTFTCSKCGDSYTEAIPALGHNYESVVTAPTCEDKGYTTHTCSRCGDSYIDSYVDAKGHAWGEWVTVKEATETEDGLKQRTCANCGEVEEQIIPAKGHTHKGEWKVVKDATCTEDGLKQLVCGCGEVLDEEVIPALGHTYDKNDYEYDKDQHWHVCDRCGEEIGHEDHVFNKHNGLCECGYKDPTWKPAVNPDDDDLPKTGDITAYITFAAATMICMVAAAGYVFKRNFLK